MRVGIHVPPLEPQAGGAYTFVAVVLEALARLRSPHTFVVLHRDPPPPSLGGGLRHVRLADGASPLDSTIDEAVRAERLEVVWFSTPGIEPVGVPFLVTVWDLEHRNQPYFPEVSVSGWDWDERELFYRSVLPRAALVLTGTEEGRRQIRDYYRVPEARIAVVPLPTPSFSAAELEPIDLESVVGALPEPYLFYPAQFWPHKNHIALLRAVRLLADEGLRVGAVLTGADMGNLAHVEATVTELGLTEQVRFLGFVERRTVVALYRGALALAFPSFFGPDNLPPLEAFALGCPVLAAAVPGAEGRLGDAALWFDPRDEFALATAIRRLHGDPALRSELVRCGLELGKAATSDDYVARVASSLDTFASVRRCWSPATRFEHK